MPPRWSACGENFSDLQSFLKENALISLRSAHDWRVNCRKSAIRPIEGVLEVLYSNFAALLSACGVFEFLRRVSADPVPGIDYTSYPAGARLCSHVAVACIGPFLKNSNFYLIEQSIGARAREVSHNFLFASDSKSNASAIAARARVLFEVL